MSEIKNDVICGSLLGDGNISRDHPRFQESHKLGQQAYLEWKRKLMGIETPVKTYTRPSGYPLCYLTAERKGHDWPRWKNVFYPNGKKQIPSSLTLNALSLLVWYMDDGSTVVQDQIIRGAKCRGYSAHIYTCAYSYHEQLILRRVLHKTFGLQPTLIKFKSREKKYYKLYFPSKNGSYDRLITVLKRAADDYNLPECMRYKLIERVETKQEQAATVA